MKNWINKESGPICGCGHPTYISTLDWPMLICLFHTYEEGAAWYMPQQRPENWPNISGDEIQNIVDRGHQEYVAAQIIKQDKNTLERLKNG